MARARKSPWSLSPRFLQWLWFIDLLAALVVTAVLVRCDGLTDSNNPLVLAAKLFATFAVAVLETSIVLFGALGIVYALAWGCAAIKQRRHADA